jgi:hypothetical protein
VTLPAELAAPAMPGSIQLSGDVAVGDLVDGRSDPNADGENRGRHPPGTL